MSQTPCPILDKNGKTIVDRTIERINNYELNPYKVDWVDATHAFDIVFIKQILYGVHIDLVEEIAKAIAIYYTNRPQNEYYAYSWRSDDSRHFDIIPQRKVCLNEDYLLDDIVPGILDERNRAETYDRLMAKKRNSSEPKPTINESNVNDEASTIITGKKGQEKTHRITANKIGEILTTYDLKCPLKKYQLVEILHKVTGLSEGSLNDSIRME